MTRERDIAPTIDDAHTELRHWDATVVERILELVTYTADLADEQRVGFVFGGGGGPTRYAWLRRGWPHLWAEYTTRWPHLTHTTET